MAEAATWPFVARSSFGPARWGRTDTATGTDFGTVNDEPAYPVRARVFRGAEFGVSLVGDTELNPPQSRLQTINRNGQETTSAVFKDDAHDVPRPTPRHGPPSILVAE
jgi:hypothetical protein